MSIERLTKSVAPSTDASLSPIAPSRFTGEFFVPGESGVRIEADHVERYRFAQQWVYGRDVLDIACGSGYGAKLLAASGASHVIGVDISEHALNVALEGYGGQVVFELGEVTDYGETDTFDVVTCFETIEHVFHADTALHNLRRVLRPGGLLLISSPNRPATSHRAKSLADPPPEQQVSRA